MAIVPNKSQMAAIEAEHAEALKGVVEYLPIDDIVAEEIINPRKAGRPRGTVEFDSKKKAQFCGLLMIGVSPDAAARVCGVTPRTVRGHMMKNPDFMAAVEEARARCRHLVESSLFMKAVEGNLSAMKYWLNNNYPEDWQDKKRPMDYVDNLSAEDGGDGVVAPDLGEWRKILEARDIVGMDDE